MTGPLSLSLAKKIEEGIFYLFLFLLPTQLGKHFWPPFSYISGLRIDYLSPTLYTTDILLLFLLIIALWNKTVSLKSFFKTPIVFVAFLLLFMRGVFSESPLLVFYGELKLAECAFLVWYVSSVQLSTRIYTGIAYALSAAVIFESILSFFQYIHHGALGGIFYLFGERFYNGATPGIAQVSIFGQLVLRPYGTFSHPNVFAGFLVVAMQTISLICFQKIKTGKLFFVFCLFVGTGALFLTFSRSAILVWFLSVLFLITVDKERKKYVMLMALFIMSVFLFFPLRERLIDFQTDESVVYRKELIESTFAMVKDYPLFGVGLYQFLLILPKYLTTTPTPSSLQPVHNIFLLVLAETGIIGSLLFLVLIVYPFRKIQVIGSMSKSFLLPLCAIVAVGFFDHYFVTLQQGQLLFSFILGLCYNKGSTV